MKLTRYCFALDLKADEKLIDEYEVYHQEVWSEVLAGIKETGIVHLEIYRVQNRLFMIMETDKTFSFERKKQIDDESEIIQKWESLMWKYQEALPGSQPGEKWKLMKKIFTL